MASAVYPLALKNFALGNILWKASGGSTVKVTAVDTADYTYNTSHEYMNTDTVPAASKIGTATITVADATTGGVCDASTATTTITGVTGDQFEALIVWMDGGGGGTTASGTTDLLICYIDSATSGLPFTPNSGDCVITWHASGIFTI